MINAHFKKVAALTLGSLLTLSSSTFASTSNVEAKNHATPLSKSEILVAQSRPSVPRPLTEVPAFSRSVAIANTALGRALAASNSAAIAGSGKSALSESIAQATSLLGDAVATADSTSVSDIRATAFSLAQAETVLGDALAIANSTAISGPGKPAISTALASAKTSVGNATAVAQSFAN